MEKRLSWNTHALLTRASLASWATSTAASQVRVESLESLLERAGPEIGQLAIQWGSAPDADARERSDMFGSFKEIHSVRNFLTALRLNPHQTIHYVRVPESCDVPANSLHNPSRSGPPGDMYWTTRQMQTISVLDVLCTYSDEPDWGMDQDLFEIEEYGYGPAPFGAENGLSSQAPFHMAFLHENPVLMGLFPELRRSFVEQRIEVSLGLARIAFSHRIPYWGWRFTAWAMHYLQDLTQPYHARIFPPSWRTVLRRFLDDPNPRGFINRNTNLLTNRHRLFEATVHYIFNQTAKRDPESPFLGAMAGTDSLSVSSIEGLMRQASLYAAQSAHEIDRVAVKMIDDSRIAEPDFFFDEDEDYHIEDRVEIARRDRPELFARFEEYTCRCLEVTGAVTRQCLALANPKE